MRDVNSTRFRNLYGIDGVSVPSEPINNVRKYFGSKKCQKMMEKSTRKVCEIKIEQDMHWEANERGGETRVIDRTIALISSDFIHGQYTRMWNVQINQPEYPLNILISPEYREKFLKKLMDEIRGLL